MWDAFAGLLHTAAGLVSLTITPYPQEEDNETRDAFYIENHLLQDLSYGNKSDMVDQSIVTSSELSSTWIYDGSNAVATVRRDTKGPHATEESPASLPQIAPLPTIGPPPPPAVSARTRGGGHPEQHAVRRAIDRGVDLLRCLRRSCHRDTNPPPTQPSWSSAHLVFLGLPVGKQWGVACGKTSLT